MFSALFAALISGIAAALVVAVGAALQLIGSSTPNPLPVVFITGAVAIISVLAGVFVAVAVRSGLLLSGCRQLASKFALIIAVVNVTVLGFLGTVPVETHAIQLETPSGSGSPVEVPLTFWLTVVAALLVPVLVGYFVGRIARGRASAA